jgi:hypothetical protein
VNESALGPLLEHRGVPPLDAEPDTLRRLAPELGLHAADLFVIAGLPMPADLRPAAGTVSHNAGRLVCQIAYLMPEDRRAVHDTIRSLPTASPPDPPVGPGPADGPGPGPLLVRLLLNRDIHPWNARLLLVVGGGPYVSDSTVFMLGGGRVALTPGFVGGIANLLDIPAGDLEAMTGLPAVPEYTPHPDRAELAAIAWDARRLTTDQVKDIEALVAERRRADPRQYCHNCHLHHVYGFHDRVEGTDDAQLRRFEDRLDRLLTRIDPEWTPPPAPGDADDETVLHHRIQHKLERATGALGTGFDDSVAALVMAAIVENSHVSWGMISALHHTGRQAALLEYLRTTFDAGTPQQRARARNAWNWSARDLSRDFRRSC